MDDVMKEKSDSHFIIRTIDRQQTENQDQCILPDDPDYTVLYEYIAEH